MELKEKIKDFVNIYKASLIMGGGLLLLILVGNFTVYYLLINDSNENNNYTLDDNISYVEENIIDEAEKVDIYYKVDIKGAVKKSGVYELKSDSRIIDVINLAGGLTENADTSVTNLSKYIKDEMVIVIYTKDEVLNFKTVIEEEKEEENKCIIYNEIIQNDSCKDNVTNNDTKLDEENTNVEVDIKVSINTADIDLLMTIPGIGESKAKSIIEYREKEGLFTTIQDITNVSGIGEKLFESIKEYITV